MASRKYSSRAQEKVERAMHERKAGTLRSSSGAKVRSRKQAIAIGLSEARAEGAKVPKRPVKPRSAVRAKLAAKKSPARSKRANRSRS